MKNSQNMVTAAYVLAAILLSAAAYSVYPRAVSSGMEEQVNKPLFEFDPRKVRELSIVKYDPETNSFDEIVMENSLVKGWTIPSKFNYPVDSSEKLVHTAASLSGLVVLAIASEDPNDEETYGVVEPAAGLKAGQEGVGIKVALKDGSKQEIASVIIGKAVADQPENRFVRIPGQRFIYVCQYDPQILDTNFFAWINPRILELSEPWQVATVELRNYQARKTNAVDVKKVYSAQLELSSNQWKPLGWSDALDPMAKPDLDVATLERVRIALENFEVQDVVRKNAAHAQALRERKGTPVTFGIVNQIATMGFFLDESTSPATEVGAGGEVAFTANNGLKFRFVFGAIIPAQVSGTENDRRYVMVSCDVDENFFPLPKKTWERKSSGGTDGAPKPPGAGALKQDDEATREAKRQYQIKLDERNSRLEAARKVADRINDRFADWFYVIDNQLYRALLPTRDEIAAKNR